MTLRTKSKTQQGLMWLGAALLAAVTYVVLARLLCSSASLYVFEPHHYRIALPLALVFSVFAWETRWDGVVRARKEEDQTPKVDGQAEDNPLCPAFDREPLSTSTTSNLGEATSQAANPSNSRTAQRPLPGEAEYAEARTMPHQTIPDSEHDSEYLELLVKSAELGYPRAMAKLGDYAMRRGWTVEAYYWLWRAKRAGMGNLERMLLQVRSAWVNGGFRRERANEYDGFSHEQGTVGYALLCIDARHNAEAAKAQLADCAPDFLCATFTSSTAR